MSSPILDRGRFGILAPTFARGGCEEYVIALALWARDAGWDTTVCLPEVDGLSSVRRDLETHGVRPSALTADPRFHYDEISFRECRRDALRSIQAHRFDRLVLVLPTIHYGGPLIDAAAVADVPAAVLYQLVPAGHVFTTVERQIYTWARRQRQTWLTVSRQNRDLLCESLGWGDDAVDVVANTLLRPVPDVDAPMRVTLRASVRAELGLPPDAFIALTVARLHPQKAHDVIIDAAAAIAGSHPQVHFVWAGSGEIRGELQGKIASQGLGGRIHMIGHRTDVDRLLHAADAFVLPSHFEGLPFAALEAMAAGVPGIYSDIGPHREIAVDGEDALLVPPGDSRALAGALERLVRHPEAAAALGAAARRRARTFTPGTSFAQLFTALDHEVERHLPPRAMWPLVNGAMRRVAIFGAGAGGRKALEESPPDVDVVAFLDSRATDNGATLLGRPVLPPDAALRLHLDGVLLASVHAPQMYDQLRALGYPAEQIELFPSWRLLSVDEA